MDNMKYLLLLAFAVSVSSRTVFDVDETVVPEVKMFELSVRIFRVQDVDEKAIHEEEWNSFKKEHAKVYKDLAEERFRRKIFLENRRKVIQHNQLYEQRQFSFKLGLNQFSDLQSDEFVATMGGRAYNSSTDNFSKLNLEAATFIGPDFDVPDSVDWRQKGAVTPVKNQDPCGSCWAFAAIGALEGQQFRKSGKLVSLSEQNLVDCSSAYGNAGCVGGSAFLAFQYIKDNGGIDTEKSYPYEAVDGICRYDAKNSGATVKGIGYTIPGNENDLKKAVATLGPIAVSLDASRPTFQDYSEGVYYDAQCSSTKLNHAVLVVGYGTFTNHGDYWIVKNSWGSSWGQSGYFLMARHKRNNCGIATRPVYPQV